MHSSSSSHQEYITYVPRLLWKHNWVLSAWSAFELHMLSGSASGRTEIKVLDYSGHQEGMNIILKRSHVYAHSRHTFNLTYKPSCIFRAHITWTLVWMWGDLWSTLWERNWIQRGTEGILWSHLSEGTLVKTSLREKATWQVQLILNSKIRWAT